VIPREFSGQSVEFADPFHADKERLVNVEPGPLEVGHLTPEVVFELIYVCGIDRLSSAHVGPPLVDPFLEHLRAFCLRH
jgi:hypothetical protein